MRWFFLTSSLVIGVLGCGSVSNNNNNPDARPVDVAACVPQSDTEFCAAANACESRTGMDNCGASRTVDCGACTGGKGCVVGTCKTPVCTTFNYTSSNFPTMSRTGVEDSIGGATPDGQVILYVQTVGTSGCGNYHLIVADEVTAGSGTYTQRDVASIFTGLGLFNGQDSYTITPDGLTIITVSTDRKNLMATKRSAINQTDFGTASAADFAAINAQTVANSKIIIGPTLSPDGLEFWYSLYDTGTGAEVIYNSVRAMTSLPFPAGTPAVAPVSSYPLVGGISSDRLTLFVFDAFTGRALTRLSTSQPFTNPNAPAAPPQIPAWAHKPLENCSKLVAMYSPGGCANEDVVVLTRQ